MPSENAPDFVKEQRIYLPILDNGSGNVKANYVAALVKAIAESGLNIELSRESDSLAGRGMNKVSASFLASDCTDLLVIDCDILCTAQDLKNLFSHDVPLVYGVYPKRQAKLENCFAVMFNGDRPDPSNPLWEVRRCGRGFTRIRRDLLERMKEENGGPATRYHNHGRHEWDFWPSGVIEGAMATVDAGNDEDGIPLREYISEDWFFCDRARALGIPVLIDTRVYANHEGDLVFPIRYTEDMLPEILANFKNDQILSAWRAVKPLTS